MHLIKFLTMKLHQGPALIDGMVISTEVTVHSKKNFVKIVQNQLLLWKPLILILQDHHVIYREIGISEILHEHLTVKQICSRWISNNLSIAPKNQSIRVAKVHR